MLPRRLLAAISAAEAEGAPAPSPRRAAGARVGLAEHATARHLKPVVTAVEMVFGSAAALSAAFGLRARPRAPPPGRLGGYRGWVLGSTVTAVEIMFGSAAALSAAFGLRARPQRAPAWGVGRVRGPAVTVGWRLAAPPRSAPRWVCWRAPGAPRSG